MSIYKKIKKAMGFKINHTSSTGKTIQTPMICAPKPQGLSMDYKLLAINTCFDLIAKSFSRVALRTYNNGKRYKGSMWYLLNVRPNLNQSATEFKYKLMYQLLTDGEVLVVQLQNGDNSGDYSLHIADSFVLHHESALYGNTYNQVQIGTLTLNRLFYQREVLHIRQSDIDKMAILNSTYNSHGDMIQSQKAQVNAHNIKRYGITGDFEYNTFDTSTSYPQQDLDDDMYMMDTPVDMATSGDYVTEQLGDFLDPSIPTAAMTLPSDFTIDSSKLNNSSFATTRDVAALIDDYIRYVGMLLHVPKQLIDGTVADVEKQLDSFISLTLAPLTDMVVNEINGKLYTKSDILSGTHVEADMSDVKAITRIDKASNYQTLLSNGIYSINEVREDMDMHHIDEDYADIHYITKNYVPVVEYIDDLKKQNKG